MTDAAADKPQGPSKYTPERTAAIVEAVRRGMTYRLAAQVGGVTYETLRTWMRKGEAGQAPYDAFYVAMRQAETDGIARNLEVIQASPDWRAHAWVLEHRHPEHYGARSTLRLEGDDDAPIRTIVAVMPAELAEPATGPDEEADDDE